MTDRRSKVSSGFSSGWIKEKVKQILQEKLTARDNDEKLCLEIWDLQLRELYGHYNFTHRWSCFPGAYGQNELANAEAIVRARRIVQDENPDLRGEDYERRQKHGRKVREAVSKGEDPNEGGPE